MRRRPAATGGVARVYGENTALIHQTLYTQPALSRWVFLGRLWLSWGVRARSARPHSDPENWPLPAWPASFSLPDGLRLIAARSRLMQALPAGGGMLSVALSESAVLPRLQARRIALAAVNGPSSVVVSGDEKELQQLEQGLEKEGHSCRRLQVSTRFHSVLMEPMLAELPRWRPPFATQAQHPRALQPDRPAGRRATYSADYWCAHVRQAVRFGDGVQQLAALGVDCCLEIGPQPVLSGLMAEADMLRLPSMSRQQQCWRPRLESLGKLYERGAEIDWDEFEKPFAGRKLALPGYAFPAPAGPGSKPAPATGRTGPTRWTGSRGVRLIPCLLPPLKWRRRTPVSQEEELLETIRVPGSLPRSADCSRSSSTRAGSLLPNRLLGYWAPVPN